MEVKHKGLNIALFNVEGEFYAVSGVCPHSKGPLAQGRLRGRVVTCPWHGAQFDVSNGRCLRRPATDDLSVYPVYVVENIIYIETQTNSQEEAQWHT